MERKTEKIKVLDVSRNLVNLESVNLNEFETILQKLELSNVAGFMNIVITIQTPALQFEESSIEAVTIRNICASPIIYPVIQKKYGNKFAAATTELAVEKSAAFIFDSKHGVKTRFATAKRGLDMFGNEVSVAAEETVTVVAFAVNLNAPIIKIYDFIGKRAMDANGAYTTQKYMSTSGDVIFTSNVRQKSNAKIKDFYFVGLTNLARTLQQLNSQISWCFSNVGAIVSTTGGDSIRIRKTVRAQEAPFSPGKDQKLSEWLLETICSYNPVCSSAIVSEMSPANDFFRMNAAHAYNALLVSGKDADEVQQYILDLSAASTIEKHAAIESRKAFDINAKFKMYCMILENKFSKTVSSKVTNLTELLATLDKKEQAVVAIEYEKVMAEINSADFKCSHYKLLRKFATADARTMLTLLRAIISQSTEKNGWLCCNECGKNIICTHTRDKNKMEASGFSSDKIKHGLMKYAIKISSEQLDITAYYCKICAGKLATAFIDDRVDENVNRFGELDSPIRTKIWSIAILTVRQLKFTYIVNDKKYANDLTSTVMPLVIVAIGKIKKQYYSGIDEINPQVHLIIIIYVYAYMLELIIKSKSERPDNRIGFAGVAADSKASDYARFMISLIANEYKWLISSIAGADTVYIKEIFTRAYENIHNSGTVVLNIRRIEAEIAKQIMTSDPIYQYARNIAAIVGKFRRKSDAPDEVRKEFETVMGVSLPALVEKAKLAMREPITTILQRPGSYIPAGTLLRYLIKTDAYNIYYKLFTLRPAAPGALRTAPQTRPAPGAAQTRPAANITDLTTDITLLTTGTVGGSSAPSAGLYMEAYSILRDYIMITDDAADKKFRERLVSHRVKEDELLMQTRGKHLFAYYRRKFKPLDVAPRAAISYLYDENGDRHVWKIFYYEQEDGTVVQVKYGDVKSTKEKAASPLKLVDRGCTVCGIKFSETHTISGDKIKKALKTVQDISSFFVYYETRCPAHKGLHEWVKDTCKFCKVNVGVFKNPTVKNADAKKYYDSFAAKFDEESKKIQTIDLNVEHGDNVLVERKTFKFEDLDYTVIVEVAKLGGVDPNVIEAFSDMSGRTYEEVVAGKKKSPPPTFINDKILILDADIRLILSDYNQHRLANEKLPENNFEYNEKFEYFKSQVLAGSGEVTAAKLHEFLLGALCKIILQIAKNDSEFAVKETKKIIYNQKMFLRPGHFNWSIFSSEEETGVDLPDDVADVGEDIVDGHERGDDDAGGDSGAGKKHDDIN